MFLANIQPTFRNFSVLSYRRIHTGNYQLIQEFYKDRSVMVTGSTGFIGQCLVEKLLRSCPDVNRIYLPIRATKSEDSNQRFEKFLKSSVFSTLRSSKPDFGDKLIPLAASLEQPNIGLSDNELVTITQDVSVVFHVAALVKFSPSLREAIQSNVQAATNVFRLAKECRELTAYIHTSTMFANADVEFVEEKIYPTKWDHNQLIDLVEKNQVSESYAADIRGNNFAIYQATKKIAENMIQLEGNSTPVAVVRPGFICPSLKEPYPAWSFGYNTYIPWLILVEKGDCRVLLGSDKVQNEFSPVDICANQLIITSWYIGTKRYDTNNDNTPLVVNQHTSKLAHLKASFLVATVNQCLKDEGRKGRVYMDSYRFRLAFRAVFPLLIQTLKALSKGEKPSLLNYHLVSFLEKCIYKTLIDNNPKEFKNLDRMIACLSSNDKKEFPCDLSEIDWEDYIRTWFKSVKNKREALERNRGGQ